MEQLQQTLNEAIKMGWKPRGYIGNGVEIFVGEQKIHVEKYGFLQMTETAHSLFSKDSGLMEFMDWREPDNGSHMILGGLLKYHYMMMGPMSATDKINYFNTNAYLP